MPTRRTNLDWKIEHRSGEVQLEYKTLPPSFIVMVLVALISVVSLIVMTANGVFSEFLDIKRLIGEYRERGRIPFDALVPFLFFLPFLAAPLVAIYTVIASFMNSYRVKASADSLSVSYGPFPWTGGFHMKKENIRQIFCTQDSGNTVVKLLDTSGRTRIVLPLTPKLDKAQEAEAALESALLITDVIVRGESNNPRARKSSDTKLWAPPKGMRITEDGDTLKLHVSGEKITGFFLLPFSLIWTGMSGFMLLMLALAKTDKPVPIFVFAFIGFFVLIGVSLFYFALATLANRHEIRTSPRGIEYSVGPLPWPGSKSYPAAGFKGARKHTYTRRTSKGGTYTVHELMLDYADGKSFSLCGSLLGTEGCDFMVLAANEKLGKSS